MPHDVGGQTHWHEPRANQWAGNGKFVRPASRYDQFMRSEGIPIFRDMGVGTVRDLPLKPWRRLGGQGSYIQLWGTEGKWGSYVVEVPGAGALNVEKHMFEKACLVLDGRGTTEVWLEGDRRRHIFEWQAGSLFSIPLNAYHRIVNATSAPARLLCGTTAPNVINALNSVDAVFNNPYQFRDRFAGADGFYRPGDGIEPDPVRGLAMQRTNLIPDVVHCELPLDNRDSPGFCRIETNMTESSFHLWIGQHEAGRYSKAQVQSPASATICLAGTGYAYMWPEKLGPTPWKDGKADQVRRLDYKPGGMISAAFGGEPWYQQHFATSKEPLRLSAWFGAHAPGRDGGVPGEELTDTSAFDLPDGGTAIPYWMEDPFVRRDYIETVNREGAVSRMEDRFYLAGASYSFAG